jgi:hypothetical protein
MKGANEMQINQATMIAALQMYFNSIFTTGNAPTVTSIAAASSYDAETFKVLTRSAEVAS